MNPVAHPRPVPDSVPPPVAIALVIAAVAVLAGGAVHLHDWVVTYRHIPSTIPGWAVVRVGFAVNAAVSIVLASGLAACAYRVWRFTPVVMLAAFGFQAASLASLIISRTGSVFGWSEMLWTAAANRTRAVEVVALVALAFSGAFLSAQRWLVAPARA